MIFSVREERKRIANEAKVCYNQGVDRDPILRETSVLGWGILVAAIREA